MSLSPGLYKIEFSTQLGSGYGLVVMDGGRVRGGDAAFAYVGTYQEDGDRFSVDVVTSRHTPTPAITSLFGRDDAKVHLHGDTSGSVIDLEGHAAEAPDITFKAVLSRLSD